MSSNDETHESDEHEEIVEEEEEEEENGVESGVEQDGSDQEESNQQQVDHEDDDQNQNNTPIEEEEEEDHDTREVIDRTNPLDEDSEEAAQNLTQEDVFGEDLSDSSGDEESRRRQRLEDQNEGQIGDEDLIEEQEEEQIVVDTPCVNADLGRDIHLVKLASFMRIEPKPFDSQYFHDEVHDDDDEEQKARLKLQIENTIRWRYNTNEAGEFVRESNTRLVRWSDGSLSLHVGKEIFDVSKANIQSDHNHLFVRHQKSMQAQAVFRTKLAFRQHGHDSLAHLKVKFASKANPAPKVRVLSNIKAASVNVMDLKKRDEQRMKAEERRRNQQLRQRERAANRDRNVSTGYLEDQLDDEDNEQVSLSAIKKNVKMKKLQGEYRTEVSDDEDDDEADDDPREKFIGQRSTTSTKHRKLIASDDEQSDDDGQESKRKRLSSAKTDEEQESD